MIARYLLPEENRTWKDVMWIYMFLKGAAYKILAHDVLPGLKGLIISTEPPISPEHQQKLGLKPIEQNNTLL